MSDGSQTLFERVLATAKDSDESILVFPWNFTRKTHDTDSFNEEFSNSKVKQKHLDELFNDLKQSEFWDPDLKFGEKMKFLGIAVAIFAVVMIPAWIIMSIEDVSLILIFMSNFLVLIGVLSPAMVIFLFARAQRKRYEAREKDFNNRIIKHNRDNFIPHEVPLKVHLFGAYISMRKPELIGMQKKTGPLVAGGNKKLTEHEKKFEAAYMDVSEGNEEDQVSVVKRNKTRSNPSNLAMKNNLAEKGKNKQGILGNSGDNKGGKL